MFKTFSFRKFDYLLLLLVLLQNMVGIMAIGSAQPELQLRQIGGLLLGIAVMILCAIPDYSKVLRGYVLYYIVTIVLLVLVLVRGYSVGEARRWFIVAGIRFQPSEAAKILLILFYAAFIMKYKDRMRTLLQILICTVLILPPLYLVFKEPDLSTTIMIFLIFCAMIFAGGIQYKYVAAVFAAAVPVVIAFFFLVLQEGQSILETWQQQRILAWLHPEEYMDTTAYQTMYSIMAIGSGQVFGKGYNTNEITSVLNSGYISESQTDFIFTVISEEFGFVGSCSVVALAFLITLKCLLIARKARDTGGMILAAGVGCWIGFQSFINIGVVSGVLPNTGLPLPFVSYGLTSLICLYGGIGFVQNVAMQSGQAKAAQNAGRIRTKI